MATEIPINDSAQRLDRWAKVRSAVAAADNNTLATFVAAHDHASQAGGALKCNDRAMIVVQARMTGASDVIKVRFLYFDRNGLLQLTSREITLTATETKDEAGLYMSSVDEDLGYDFPSYRLKVTSITGTPTDVYTGTKS